MTRRLPLQLPASIFRDDEPVIQSQPMLDGAQPPVFGATDCWDLNGVLKRPANMDRAGMRIQLFGLSPAWNLMAREMAMILLNPRHPAVLARGIHLSANPLWVTSVGARVGCLRALAVFGANQDLPADVTTWSDDDFKDYIRDRMEALEPTSVHSHVASIKFMHEARRALACGGLRTDPWPDTPAHKVVGQPAIDGLKTPAISPETWFPLVRAAWQYVSIFGLDVLRARDLWQDLQASVRPCSLPEADKRFEKWLRDPGHRIPLHGNGPHKGKINWLLLKFMIGLPEKTAFFTLHTSTGRTRRARAEQEAAEGRTQPGLCFLTEVDRPDGSHGPWHPGLQPRDVWVESVMLRNACYILVAAVSMMRDSEIQEITKESVVEYFSAPAVKSTKRKGDADLPTKHWWVIEQAAQAIGIAESLSTHDERVFASLRNQDEEDTLSGQYAIDEFIARVNRDRHHTGLDEIPVSTVQPHMFRKTMAMLCHDFPGSEIAVGMQLKHIGTRALANRSTQGYMKKDPAWEKYFEKRKDKHFERLAELFDADTRGEPIGFGPGADTLRAAFAAIRDQAEHLRATGQASRGDLRVEHDLLRRSHISLRFGKLNHCAMPDNTPDTPPCLDDTLVPPGHTGPLLDRCRPSRCANSVIAPAHLPIWKAEHSSLTRLLTSDKVAPNHRASLGQQLRDVELVLKREPKP